eukprot:scaffold33407_cov112-Isochrysis_galbana.AAC.7
MAPRPGAVTGNGAVVRGVVANETDGLRPHLPLRAPQHFGEVDALVNAAKDRRQLLLGCDRRLPSQAEGEQGRKFSAEGRLGTVWQFQRDVAKHVIESRPKHGRGVLQVRHIGVQHQLWVRHPGDDGVPLEAGDGLVRPALAQPLQERLERLNRVRHVAQSEARAAGGRRECDAQGFYGDSGRDRIGCLAGGGG